MSRKAGMGFLNSAEEVLKKAKKPMNCKEIVAIATKTGLLDSKGKTPERTLYALFQRHITADGERCKFYSPEPGFYALRQR